MLILCLFCDNLCDMGINVHCLACSVTSRHEQDISSDYSFNWM